MPIESLLEQMRRNPRDWRIADVERVCRTYAIQCTPPRTGSHYKVKHPSVQEFLVVPAARPIKPVYIRALVRFINAVGEAET